MTIFQYMSIAYSITTAIALCLSFNHFRVLHRLDKSFGREEKALLTWSVVFWYLIGSFTPIANLLFVLFAGFNFINDFSQWLNFPVFKRNEDK